MISSWDELIEKVGTRPGMWVGRERYVAVRSFVAGFGAARDDGILEGFQAWLSEQPQHRTIRDYTWSSLVLHEAFPHRDQPAVISWNIDDPANAGWPKPPDQPVGEDSLSYPEDDAVAIRHLFRRLKQYLDDSR